eukprot:scaffold326356_cov18-Prasinocladus_malaysianus.AAC.2
MRWVIKAISTTYHSLSAAAQQSATPTLRASRYLMSGSFERRGTTNSREVIGLSQHLITYKVTEGRSGTPKASGTPSGTPKA